MRSGPRGARLLRRSAMASSASAPEAPAGPDDDIASRRFDGLSIRDKRGRDTATVRVDVTRKGVKLDVHALRVLGVLCTYAGCCAGGN